MDRSVISQIFKINLQNDKIYNSNLNYQDYRSTNILINSDYNSDAKKSKKHFWIIDNVSFPILRQILSYTINPFIFQERHQS